MQDLKMKNFYLIDPARISELGESDRKELDDCLNVYHSSSSFSDKAVAIQQIVNKNNFKKIQFKYNQWLYDFVSEHYNTLTNEEEIILVKKILASCHFQMARQNKFKGEYDKYHYNYQQILNLREELDDKEGLSKAYNDIGFIYHEQGNIAKALESYHKSIALSEDKIGAGLAYQNLSVVMVGQGNYSKALEYVYKALKIFEDINHTKGIAMAYHSIGLALVDQHKIDEALTYFYDALELYKKTSYTEGRASLYGAIGSIYQKKNQIERALEYHKRALKTHPTKFGISNSLFNIGRLYQNKNQHELALEYYYKSLNLRGEIDNKQGQSTVLNVIGLLEMNNGALDKASQQIETSFLLAQELGYPFLIKDAAHAKVKLALKNEDYKLAYEMEKLGSEMKDKVQSATLEKDFIKQQFKHEHDKELLKKDLEIEFEKKNAQLIKDQSDILESKNQELASKNEIINKQVAVMSGLITKLEESNNNLKQFAAVAAHDLKAPLRNIQSFSQILHAKYASEFPKEDMEFFMFIINSCKSLKELIDSLLNYSRISNMEFQPECVNLNETIAEVKNNLRNTIKQTEFTINVSKDLPLVVGQKSLLFQVLLNFINNAIKFRKTEDEVQSSIWIDSAEHTNGQTTISVKDNGIGIKQTNQDQIFGIFKKFHSSVDFEGNGIGLSVCKKIIERLGGKIWLESEPAMGTTFFFTLSLYDKSTQNRNQNRFA